MKKGVLRKGKLGFLNNMNLVSVINTTHIGPKRNLVVVKVHNQVFLLGSSESGVNLISELNDFPGVLKDTERFISGDNFDEKLNLADLQDKEVKLKEELSKNSKQREKKSSFSDQIKEKVKSLKPLQ
jgi:flagellar biogenesis protein FliO